MNWTLFPSFQETLLALLVGFVFGFLLRKSTLSRFDTMIGQLLLRDFTVLKVVLAAVITASIGFFLQAKFVQKPTLNLSSMPLMMTGFGGALFGIGLAITGYTPGTMIAAIGEGTKEAITGFFGMIIGSFLFNHFYPCFMKNMSAVDGAKQKTMHGYFGFSEWMVIVSLIAILFVISLVSRKKR
jgi:hypothetical protein